jgi:hypothetical protein
MRGQLQPNVMTKHTYEVQSESYSSTSYHQPQPSTCLPGCTSPLEDVHHSSVYRCERNAQVIVYECTTSDVHSHVSISPPSHKESIQLPCRRSSSSAASSGSGRSTNHRGPTSHTGRELFSSSDVPHHQLGFAFSTFQRRGRGADYGVTAQVLHRTASQSSL